MASAPFSTVVRYFRGSAPPAAGEEPTDQQLLARFARGRDEAAFAALVGRHGPLVMGVCRRVLPNAADAEDAFQATFLVLARRANLVAWRSSVANWLHGTALRLARKLLVADSRRRAREKKVAPKTEPAATAAVEWQELCNLLDAELRRLPTSERAALLSCYFEGRTQDEAARELGWSLRTLQRRLERGRDLLRSRLMRKGLPLPVAFLAGVLLNEAAAAGKAAETARAAAVFVTGGTPTARAAASTLAVTVLRENARRVARIVVAGLVLLGLCAAAVRYDFLSPEEEDVDLPAVAAGMPIVRPAVDAAGDRLPEGAVSRLGSVRFRHSDVITCAAFSRDGMTVVTGDRAGRVTLWDVDSGWRLREIRNLPRKAITALAVSPEGKILVTQGEGVAMTFSTVEGIRLGGQDHPPTRAAGRIAMIENHRLVFRDAKTGKELDSGGQYYRAERLTVSPDGRTAASWSEAEPQTLDIWDVATGKRHEFPGHRNTITSLSFSADGGLLVSADGVGTAQLWEPLTGREQGTAGPIWCHEVVCSPDGSLFAGFQSTTNLSGLYDVRTGQQLDRLVGYSCSSRHVVFSADGRLLVEGVWGRRIARLWDVQTGETVWEIGVGQDRPARVTLSPGGSVVASGGYNGGVVRRWNTRTGFQLRTLSTPHEMVRTVALGPGARTMATCGGDDPVYLWDTHSGKQLARLDGLGGAAQTLAFSADGRLLLGAGNGRARLWDVAGGSELERFEGHEGPITAAALSADGRLAATGSSDTTILVWDLTGGKTADLRLTPAELDRLWADLDDADDRTGYRAAGMLAAVPRQSVPFLAERLPTDTTPTRTRRALRTLEHINSPEARQLLEKLGSGPADTSLSREARALSDRILPLP